jgi:hypothetical protein
VDGEDLWGTFLQSYKATQDRDNVRAFTKFELECKERIERIVAQKPFEGSSRDMQMGHRGFTCSSLKSLFQFQSNTGDNMGHFNSDEKLCDESTSERMEDGGYCDDEGFANEWTATIESHAEDSHVSGIAKPCYELNLNYTNRKRSVATVMEDELI